MTVDNGRGVGVVVGVGTHERAMYSETGASHAEPPYQEAGSEVSSPELAGGFFVRCSLTASETRTPYQVLTYLVGRLCLGDANMEKTDISPCQTVLVEDGNVHIHEQICGTLETCIELDREAVEILYRWLGLWFAQQDGK
jgi:hypothetical protein